MKGKKELKITVTAKWLKEVSAFEDVKIRGQCMVATFDCMVEHNLEFGPDITWKGFTVYLPFLVREKRAKHEFDPRIARMNAHITFSAPSEATPKILSDMLLEFDPISRAIHSYDFTEDEYNTLKDLLLPEIHPKVNKYFGEILKKILEDETVGYSIIIETPYFASPTSAGYLAPMFVAPLKKDFEPKIQDGYETIYTYFSYEKPHSKAQVQLRLLDEILEEKLENIELQLKENLSAYGLKVLYLILRECDRNGRQPWFELDTNNCLDLLGCKRTKRGVHDQRNRRRLSRELHALTDIKFNVVAEIPKGPKPKKFFKMNGSLISATEFGVYEANENETIETARQIRDGIRIFVNPDMYMFIHEGYYTMFPDAFLAIDAGRREHAIRLYQYILNQWRIGWHQYYGVIKQPLHQMLEGSGAKAGWPRRKNKQRDFVNKIIDHLQWLKRKKEFWIKSVHIERANRSPLNPMITVVMAEDHPFKQSMKNVGKIEKKVSA